MNNRGIHLFVEPLLDNIKLATSIGGSPDYYDMLTNYITGNIMASKRECEELLQSINGIEAGRIEEDEHSGNACDITITRDGARIGMFIDKGVVEITTYPLWLFKKAIEEYYDFLQTGRERELEFDYEPQEHEKTQRFYGVI